MGSTEDALRAAYSVANSRDEWATGIVTAGVVIELVALLLFGKEMPRNEKAALAVGSILVVLGVSGEWVFGSRASAIAVQLQQASNEKIAGLAKDEGADHKIAAQAAAHAADLGVTVDNLQNFVTTKQAEASAAATAAKIDAAKVTTALNAERDVRQKFAAMVEARDLDKDKTTALSAALKHFTGQQFQITTYLELKEPVTFSNQVYTALLSAGWQYIKPERAQILLGGVAGVLVYVHPEAGASAKSAAEALVKALQMAGFDAEQRAMNDPGHPTQMLELNIGTKN